MRGSASPTATPPIAAGRPVPRCGRHAHSPRVATSDHCSFEDHPQQTQPAHPSLRALFATPEDQENVSDSRSRAHKRPSLSRTSGHARSLRPRSCFDDQKPSASPPGWLLLLARRRRPHHRPADACSWATAGENLSHPRCRRTADHERDQRLCIRRVTGCGGRTRRLARLAYGPSKPLDVQLPKIRGECALGYGDSIVGCGFAKARAASAAATGGGQPCPTYDRASSTSSRTPYPEALLGA